MKLLGPSSRTYFQATLEVDKSRLIMFYHSAIHETARFEGSLADRHASVLFVEGLEKVLDGCVSAAVLVLHTLLFGRSLRAGCVDMLNAACMERRAGRVSQGERVTR